MTPGGWRRWWTQPVSALPRRVTYALLGALLSTGAPLGLILLKAFLVRSLSLDWLVSEIADYLITYLYLSVSTGIVFTLFGFWLGTQSDHLIELLGTDPLSGLHNARMFQQRLNEEFARAVRYRHPLSLLLIDIDNLKEINDRKGHAAGDRAIQNIGEAIRSQLRAVDFGARWGGDEFALIAPNTSNTSAGALAERLRLLIIRNTDEAGRPFTTASIGIATLDPSSSFPAEAAFLQLAADEALYRAKMAGRNRVALADSPLEITTVGAHR